jgi:hypothetical protein
MSEVTDLVEEWSNRTGRMKLAINTGSCVYILHSSGGILKSPNKENLAQAATYSRRACYVDRPRRRK